MPDNYGIHLERKQFWRVESYNPHFVYLDLETNIRRMVFRCDVRPSDLQIAGTLASRALRTLDPGGPLTNSLG